MKAIVVCAVVLVSLANISQSTAQVQQHGGKPKPPAGIKIVRGFELSAAQCTGLGGSVEPHSNCPQKKTCVTADIHGVIRYACIDELDR